MPFIRKPQKSGISQYGRGFAIAAAGGAVEKAANATNFDGTNDYMGRTSDLTGNADSKVGILSFWVDFNAGDGVNQYVYQTNSENGINICLRRTSNLFNLQLLDPTGASFCIDATNSTATVAASGWVHMLYSWDLAAGPAYHCYRNDADDADAAETLNNLTINYTHASHFFGATTTGTSKVNGCLSEIYFNTAEFLDFSIESNRRKFISSGGKPIDLGSDGSTPTGTAPIIYQPNAFGTFEQNEGTGGDFTVTGAFTDCATSPSD